MLAVGVGVASLRYLNFAIQGVLYSKDAGLLQNIAYRAVFYAHVVFGVIALVSGPFQFFPHWRQQRLRWHRALGKVYVVACLAGGIAGLLIAFFATGGLVSSLGFSGLALGWLYSTTRAWRSIRQKNVSAHHRWMIRSFALTFAAVTLRIWLPLFTFGFGWPFEPSYRVISWLCWVPNLLLAEWIIARKNWTETVPLPANTAL